MKVVKGDLIEMFKNEEFELIIHGCNCFNTMGAGFAGQIANSFPEAYNADKETVRGDINKLSDWTVSVVKFKKFGVIINLYTQFEPGRNLNLAALELGMYKLSKKIDLTTPIAIPKIGCGIAGGDWNVVQPIIEKYFNNHNLTVVEFDKTERNDKL